MESSTKHSLGTAEAVSYCLLCNINLLREEMHVLRERQAGNWDSSVFIDNWFSVQPLEEWGEMAECSHPV